MTEITEALKPWLLILQCKDDQFTEANVPLIQARSDYPYERIAEKETIVSFRAAKRQRNAGLVVAVALQKNRELRESPTP